MAGLIDCRDREWLDAEALLRSAQRLPAGLERVEALKLAGMQRLLASRKLFEEDGVERQVAHSENHA